MVPVQTWPERLARKTTGSVPAWLAILRSTLNEPLRPPVVAEPLAATEPLSLIFQRQALAGLVAVDLALDLEAAVVGLDLELPVGAVGAAAGLDDPVVVTASMRGRGPGAPSASSDGGGQGGQGEREALSWRHRVRPRVSRA